MTDVPMLRMPEVRPNALDRLINFVSPRTALRRLRARAALEVATQMASHVGARTDRRALTQWLPSAGSANADLIPELPTLRARSRDLARNAPLAGGALNTVVTNVVGTGLQLHPHVDRELLGLSEDEAMAWEKRIRQIWQAWASSADCDITRTQNFAGLQELAFRSTFESGDVLAVRRFTERRGDVLGLKVQLIEADRICNPQYQPDTKRLAGGVEVDGNGSPIRYHVLNTHPGDLFFLGSAAQRWIGIPVRGRSSDARIAQLLYRRTRPGQLRGLPYLAPVIEPLKSLDRYTEAELTAAVVASLFTVFIKAEGEAGGAGGLAPIDSEDTNPPAAGDYKLGSGAILDLLPGEDVEVADPKRPNEAFDVFVQSILRQVGVALELPFEVLIKHFSRSYSAARASMLEAWRFFRNRREWLATSFCQLAYEWAVREAIAREMIAAPGFDDAVVRQGWLRARWTGPSPGQIDPEREVKAAEKRIQIGVATLEEETAALTGGNWEEKHEQRARERRMRYETGLESSELEQGKALPRPPAGQGAKEAETEEEVAA